MKRYYLLENEMKMSREEKRAFMESIKQFQKYKNEVYRASKLK
jgi:hypothetical protein